MELLTYTCLTFVAIVYGLTKARKLPAILVLWIAAAAYFIAARFAPFDFDFRTYAEALHVRDEALRNPYFLREAAYWVTSVWLYRMIGDERVTFLVFDFFAVGLLFAIRRKFNLPLYIVPLLLVMFPSVLGAQNVYRQFLGSIVLLLALSTDCKHYRWPLFFLAGLFHNSMLLFGPLMFVYGLPDQQRRPLPLVFFLSSFAIVLALPYAAETKSSASTGANLTLVYASLPMLVVALTLALNRLKIPVNYTGMYLSILYMFGITAASAAMLSSAGAERIGMVCLFLLIPILAFYIEGHVKQSWVVRPAMVIALVAPVLIFSSSRALLSSG